ncbi:polar amino acid transport system substrate-binding protein [Aureimonas altamirensis DSM 21988]|jgi:polar amino acid transport system substrate-binding protein|uniref:Polar amino acid transport system substrate-binding protein n=2 Tax=Aureimonas altamirensis TaxID=370622 RepID=A0ABY1I7S8_9HYPH|nr:polar amino acid transport system substrate-binding protein [Aureimonas altamirensis DSM 21988]
MNMLKMALVAGVVLCGANAALADAYDDIIAAGKIRVSTDLAIPPSGMLDAELQPIGSDVETAKLLAGDWGLELEFVPTTGATRIPNLQTGKADVIISTLSVTPQRAEVIDFTVPYAALNSVVGAPKAADISDWEGLRGKAVTVTRGTTQDTALTPLAGERGYTITRYDDDATMVTAAVSGQAAAVATSETLINQIGQRNPELGFEPKFTIQVFDLAMGVRKGETQLKEKLDAWITENLKNGKLNDIYQKYHGSPLPAEMLN